MSVEEVFIKLFEQSPTMGLFAGLAYAFWRALERLNARADEKAERLFQRCHDAHKSNAEHFARTAERNAERYEDQAVKSAEIATRLHTALGEMMAITRHCAEDRRDLMRLVRNQSDG